jgi:hypothetical protein
MNEGRIVIAQFCDDIRYEVGNKYSLIGCYSDELIVDKLPALLPKLCVQVRAFTPIDKVFSKLALRAFLGDDVIAEAHIELGKVSPDDAPADATRMSIMTFLLFSPLGITEPSMLRIEAETEDGVLTGGKLRIRERAAEELPPDNPQHA